MMEPDRSDRQEETARQQPRKPYAAPRLTEYGDVETLTQGAGPSGPDFASKLG
jgi:hypothetical protein